MFEKLTQAARSQVARARDEASALHAPRIGGEHLLLALLREEAVVAFPVLTAAGLSHARVAEEVARLADGPAGLLSEEDAEALRTIGIDLAAVLARISATFGEDALLPAAGEHRRPRRSTSSARYFTAEARKAIELALREALRCGSRQITDGHLLLGLLRADGLAVRVLTNLGVRPADLRAALAGPQERAA